MDDGQSQEPAEQVGRPRAPQRRSPLTPPPSQTPAAAEPGRWHASDADGESLAAAPSTRATAPRARRPPSAGAVPAAPGTPRATRTTGTAPHLPRGAGEHFQPLPNALLVAPHDDRDGPSATIPAPAGTPVHAVCAGTVHAAGGGVVRIDGEDGFTWEYAGVGDVRVPDGLRVDAGGIIGVLGDAGQQRHVLRLSVADRSGTPARLHEVLRGAVDPNDLGYGAAGTGVDIDPDAHVAPRGRRAAVPAPVIQETRHTPAAPTDPASMPGYLKPVPAPPRPADGGLKPVPAPPKPMPPTPAPGGLRPVPPPPRRAVPPRRDPQPAEPERAQVEPTSARDAVSDPDASAPPAGMPAPASEPAHGDERNETAGEVVGDAPDDQAPERSGDERRERAAMLIANRRRRPRDTGSS